MNTSSFTATGITPLILHNGRLSDPLDEWTQALAKLTSKRKKTIDDHKAVSKTEWYGGMYVDEDGAPCLPGEVIEACLVEGAKKYKLGKASKGGLVVLGNYKIKYEGPKSVDKLWEHGGFLKRASVKVGMARVIRSRPIFQSWSCTFDVTWDPALISDESTLREIVDSAGQSGICDWRPKFGRFQVS